MIQTQARSNGRGRKTGAEGRSATLLRWAGVAACYAAMLAAGVSAHGSAALLLEQPYGHLGVFDPAGHSAIYLDHVCAETPLKLRACGPGELGVVLSRYDGIGDHDWVAIPLIPYLYAVDSVEDIPQTVDRATEERLRDDYRRKYLQTIAPDRADGTAPGGNWYEMVGSSLDRTIYGFRVKTTPEQDAGLIAMFNDRGNTEHYNGFFRNCADFARTTLNHYYPHAVRRNFVADFGITSPKSVARSLAHYAHKHPEAELDAFLIPQVKGELPRSHKVEDVSESLLKKYGLPLVVLSPETTAVVLAAYIGHGRFALPKNPPVLNVAALQAEAMFPTPSAGTTAERAPEGVFPSTMTPRMLLMPSAAEPPALPAPEGLPMPRVAGENQ